MFWDPENKKCSLCPRNCIINENATGFCRVRKNISGKLFSMAYGRPCSINIDPIEKKPLFHFAPGSRTLSVATIGCNFSCQHCQNFDISMAKEVFGEDVSPEQLEEMIGRLGLPGFSWTYTEPTIFYEYFYDTALLAKEKYNVWVTNGFTVEEPIRKAKNLISAVNVDYKGDDEFYRKICSARLEPVLESMKLYKKLGIWMELTNLVIPGHNDSKEQISEMCEFVVAELGKDVPLHFSRYYPMHRMNVDATSKENLEKAAKIAEDFGINYIYLGNIRTSRENTLCPNCGNIIIERNGYEIVKFSAVKKNKNYRCPSCNHEIPLAGMQWSAFGK